MFHFDTPTVPVSDDDLIAALPGFSGRHVDADGIQLHVVTGGEGPPLVLLPSWPMTWWEYRKVLPSLAQHFRVLAVDLRGMGASAKPAQGYDKKTMATDLAWLLSAFEIDAAHIVGNDIGAMVAYSFAANFGARTRSLTMLDTPHPFAVFKALPLMPEPGVFDVSNTSRSLHPWWFAFNQVPGLPEALFAGRFGFMQNWTIDYLSHDLHAVSDHDRAVFTAAYDDDASVRASLEWFRAFDQDIKDAATYAPLTMPVTGLGGIGFDFLAMFLQAAAPGAKITRLEKTGHWIPSEQPDALVAHLRALITA